jgi:hypothetical protein
MYGRNNFNGIGLSIRLELKSDTGIWRRNRNGALFIFTNAHKSTHVAMLLPFAGKYFKYWQYSPA